MKKITQDQLNTQLELHNLWLVGLEGGVKLDLSYYDLSGLCFEGTNLEDVCLEGANLRGNNLRGANIEGANLKGVDLEGVCLEDAILTGACLVDATLTDANLSNTGLWRTIGEGAYIKSLMVFEEYHINYTHDRLQIGCENHSIEDWANFSDERIIKMDGKKALKFWREYKEYILDTIDRFPAENPLMS